MKSINITSTLCAGMMALHGAAFAGGEGWSSDYAASTKLAAESKKDLLIDFTGSDWCGWCIKLNDEVFKHDAFKEGVKDSFVLVELDYPQDKSKLSEETQAQNEELGKKYSVQGYPTILLCDAQGRPYAGTGYQEGGPEKYVKHLNELRGKKDKRDKAFAAAQEVEGVGKAKALVAALEAMALQDEMVAMFYGDIAEQIKAADPKDETGFGKKAADKQRLADFQTKLQGLAQKQDMDGALALVDETLKEGGFGQEETLQMMMTRAVIYAQLEKLDEAVEAVDAAIKLAPDSPMIPGINDFRERLVEGQKKTAEVTEDKDETEDEEEVPTAE